MAQRFYNPTVVLLVLLAAWLAVGVGCIEERVVRQAFSDLPIDPHGPQPFEGMMGGQQHREARELWTIPLERFEGRTSHFDAQERLQELREHASFDQLWSEDMGGESVIYHGRFRDRQSDGAQAALRYTRDLHINGERPYAQAVLVPLESSERVSDPYDLQQYHSYYSLQIAVYDNDHTSDRFDAAEDRVAELRAEDHEAFYYHGPHRSMVTVGLFHREQAFDAVSNPLAQGSEVDAYSDLVRQVQDEFPYHMVNDISVVEATGGEIAEEPPSVLIRVP